MDPQPEIQHSFENPPLRPAGRDSEGQAITPHRKINWLLVIIITVGFFSVLTAGYFLGTSSSRSKAVEVAAEPTPTEYVIPTAMIDPTRETANEAQPSIFSSKKTICKNDYLKISLNLPTGWTCESTLQWITIKSPVFNIHITDLGRGLPCGEGPTPPNSDESCIQEEFYYYNGKIGLDTWLEYNKIREIWGFFSREFSADPTGAGALTHMSITFENKDKRYLTESEKNLLIQIIDSVEPIK